MTALSTAIYLIPIFIGILLVHIIWNDPDIKLLLLKFALGIEVGIGLTALLYFVFLFIDRPGFLYLLLTISLALTFAVIRKWEPPQLSFKKNSLTQLQKLLLLSLAIIVLIDLGTFISTSLRRPHGSWDSWMIWNRVARFIYLGEKDWQRAFSSEFYWLFHPDYPPLIPLTNAWVWGVLKSETVRVPAIQSGIFLFTSGLLLFTALYVVGSIETACLATIILMGTPSFISNGSGQLADVPLAVFILATVIIFSLYNQYQQTKLLILAGITAALAAWTKNEGLVFLICSFGGLFVLCYQNKHIWQAVTYYFVGIVTPLTILLYFKFQLAPANDLFNSTLFEIWQRVSDSPRYVITLKALLTQILYSSGIPYTGSLLVIYYFLMNGKKLNGFNRGLLAVLIMLVIQLVAYFAIYIITPNELDWQIDNSFERVILHIYPATLFLIFSTIGTSKIISHN